MIFQNFLIFLFFSIISASFVGWNKVSVEEIQKAIGIGISARRDFVTSASLAGKSRRDRHLMYLKGLQKCNMIDDELIAVVNRDVIKRKFRKSDAEKLEQIGLSTFFSEFVTLPTLEMKHVIDFACAKHEKQLECGLHYEGKERTEKQVKELMDDGPHKLMFEHECVNETYATRVYPCLGKTDEWIGKCEKEIRDYSNLRKKVNSRITTTYDSAIETVKTASDDEKQQIFTATMKFISFVEGTKCLAFKKMRVCILEQLVSKCGIDTARAFNTSVSIGYLRNERSHRLQSDFDHFGYPAHPLCDNL